MAYLLKVIYVKMIYYAVIIIIMKKQNALKKYQKVIIETIQLIKQ